MGSRHCSPLCRRRWWTAAPRPQFAGAFVAPAVLTGLLAFILRAAAPEPRAAVVALDDEGGARLAAAIARLPVTRARLVDRDRARTSSRPAPSKAIGSTSRDRPAEFTADLLAGRAWRCRCKPRA
jgi:hypothetical protein